ncbi:AAA family ATPase [Thiocystis violacea]|uniref:AAA family ATPase n=1 Tax=Thiocystis violacea TaxID=13725 RepID=UPI00190884BC|nr:peptidoglycan-binding protein [Thiocystis violacea]
MYPKYFGLKEPSFSIAPDPHYLFLSEQHKEALAHLLYGAGESGGFVLLTGEVGTGKTTVCRAFLEQLPEGVDVALILNPAQSANELLTNVCDEFRIPLPKGKLSNKMLVDRLNAYLLAAHSEGRRPLLIIDEAQNLQPQAMEQVRLLTNLETTKHKLLQIFLIGQPELRRMLERDRLRQLNQRITARFHLTPFSLRETSDYIRHRVAVAGVDRPLFSARAIRRIYKFSGGIPRLINILCDRALLGTCVTRGSQVTPAIVARSAREVRGDPVDEKPRSPLQLTAIALVSFGLAAALALAAHSRLGLSPTVLIDGLFPAGELATGEATPEVPPVAEPAPAVTDAPAAGELSSSAEPAPQEPQAVASASEGDLASIPVAEPAEQPAPAGDAAPGVLASPDAQVALASSEVLDRLAVSKSEAMRVLLKRWGLEVPSLGTGDPCLRIVNFGLGCEEEQGRLSHVRFFDLPALMKILAADGAPRYVVLGELGASEAVVDDAQGTGERVRAEALERVWTGDYTLVWQLPPTGVDLIGPGSAGEDVRWLRDLLVKVPDLAVLKSDSAFFDAALASALKAFQASKGLMPDGIAGPRTIIALQHAVAMRNVPRLSGEAAASKESEGAP